MYITTFPIPIKCIWVRLPAPYRLVSYPDDVGHRASATVLHDDPEVTVLKVAAVVTHHMRAGDTNRHMSILTNKKNQTF